MISEEQTQKRIDKMKDILNVMHKCGTIKEISEYLNIPTSTIQRYLNNEDLYTEVVISEQIEKDKLKDMMNFTKDWLQNAKRAGLKRGGESSQSKYGYSKDESGKFCGKTK